MSIGLEILRQEAYERAIGYVRTSPKKTRDGTAYSLGQ